MLMMHFNIRIRRAAQGFTLVEVMVALIIIAVGMLGIAKMQGLALSSTNASRSRALASIAASSLASAMQANRTYWSATGSLPGTITVTASAGTVSLVSTSATMQTAINTASASGVLCGSMGTTSLSCLCTNANSAPCTTYINLAASDLYDWAQTLNSILPNAIAYVTCNNGNLPVDCSIQITWNENTVALTTQQANYSAAAAGNSTIAMTYSLYVVP
jgi:type IV pilus assembly protein PilV